MKRSARKTIASGNVYAEFHRAAAGASGEAQYAAGEASGDARPATKNAKHSLRPIKIFMHEAKTKNTRMKNRLWTAALALFIFTGCDTLSGLQTVGGTGGGPVTQSEAGEGIREALSQGIAKAILSLNKQDGFFGNQAYKLFLPEEARKAEQTLRDLGMGGQVDKAILQINRAAEDAVGFAKPIFVNAIKQMTITDALNIVKGSDTAATAYFRSKTSAQLLDAFRPSVQNSLDKLEATRYYGDVVNLYNRIPTVKKINPDLTSFVVGKATDALFDQIAKEESNIRANPLARTTEILKRVFGK